VTILEVRDLAKSYGDAAPVLRGVSFKVEPAEFIGIIGLSGSGKSTLLRCINRLVDTTSGSILLPSCLLDPAVNGGMTDITKAGRREMRLARRKIGMVFQQFNLVKRLSVIDNVLSGGLGSEPVLSSALRVFRQTERDHALACLERVGLLRYAYQRADQLSGGEQQRVAIARTLMQRPVIILADEPVSSLDPTLSRLILDILKGICRENGIAALVSLHTLELTRAYADRVIGLKHGIIFFDGPIAKLSDWVAESVYQRND